MPTTPSSSATPAAMATIASANEVCAIDRAASCSMLPTFASGTLLSTHHTARWISRRKPGDPVLAERTTQTSEGCVTGER